MSRVLADTGPLYAAVDRRDAHHRRALREMARLEETGSAVVVPYPVVLEAYSLVMRRMGTGVAFDWLADLLEGSSWFNPEASDYHAAARLVQRYPDQEVTLVDATLAVLTVRLGLAVWTYDHHFDILRAEVWRA